MQNIRIQRRTPPLPRVLADCLPLHLTDAVARCGVTSTEELRMHSDRYTTVTCKGKSYSTGVILSREEMGEILRKMCRGSLYAFAQSMNRGYLPLSGGIRVGVCGKAAVEDGRVIGVSEVSGLIARIPQQLSVDASFLLEELKRHCFLRGALVFAPPGVGKTTLLRALALAASSPPYSMRTVAVDTREELSHAVDGAHCTLDVLVGYPKEIGIEIAVRSLGAQLILCDEIGNPRDAQAILLAANCGVPLVASAHAASVVELLARPAIRQLHHARVFEAYVGITRREPCDFSHQITSWEEAQRLLSALKANKEETVCSLTS